ncbi:unnamed protein product [Adineta ricciae]|uniref:Endonuclease/exonuclease/phosphatase domain-containing protein n=1 Tax=Adineta ricciae TaxID=249248 RepID=A0A814D9Y0_ADIRI|nr:unnamed protein product [Adineta ricciae]
MSTFRLATLNVHVFNSPKNEINNNDRWRTFCQRLSLPNFIYGQGDQHQLGNGLASRYPIDFYSNQQSYFPCRGGTRGLLKCRLKGDHPFTKDRIFAVTHLDHIHEDNRLQQIRDFSPHSENIDILMGDMNALTKDDYSDGYYRKQVVEMRESFQREKPRFDLTKLLTDEWKYHDAFKLRNPQVKDELIATCPYGTRVDYIYIRPRDNDQWFLSECSIIDTNGETDHNAVFAEFKLKLK